jgi:hypothetical protein
MLIGLNVSRSMKCQNTVRGCIDLSLVADPPHCCPIDLSFDQLMNDQHLGVFISRADFWITAT